MTGQRSPYLTGLILLLALPMTAAAQRVVIYDAGHTRSIVPYLKSVQQVEPRSRTNRSAHPLISGTDLGPAKINNLLPIRSPELTIGLVTMKPEFQEVLHRLTLGHARPFFLIGSDERSQRWLASRRAELARVGAVGMLIQAETEADVRRIAELAQGLPITLGSASDIAKALGIEHYPVLISSNSIEQ